MAALPPYVLHVALPAPGTATSCSEDVPVPSSDDTRSPPPTFTGMTFAVGFVLQDVTLRVPGSGVTLVKGKPLENTYQCHHIFITCVDFSIFEISVYSRECFPIFLTRK